MEWYVSLSIIIGLLLVLVAAGMPIAFALGVVDLFGIVVFLGPRYLEAVSNIVWGATNEFVFVAIPLFFLMGEVLSFAGLSKDMFDAGQNWVGRLPGGLGIATVVASTIFGAIAATGTVTAAVVGRTAIPEMRRWGYSGKLSTAIVASTAGLGMIIPPSIPLVIYGVITEQSVGKLFIASIGPGLLIPALFAAYLVVLALRDPLSAPRGAAVTWKARLVSLRGVTAVTVLTVAVVGVLFLGIATATESAGAGAVGALILAALYRKLTWRRFWEALQATVEMSGFIIPIIFGAMLFGYLLAALNIPQLLSEWVTALAVSRWVVFTMVMVLYLILGMFMDVGSIALCTMPIVFPIMTALGFDPIWFGMVWMVNMCIAVVTPPVGLCTFVVSKIAPDVPMMDIVKGSVPFMVLYLVVIGLLSVFPQIAMWLPNMMG